MATNATEKASYCCIQKS